MKIKVKSESGRKIEVDVSEENCAIYRCFSPHKYQHREHSMDGSVKIIQDKFYSCSFRNYHGCPEKKFK